MAPLCLVLLFFLSFQLQLDCEMLCIVYLYVVISLQHEFMQS